MAGRPRHTPCAELPNDNGTLHEGARWMPRDPLSQPRAWLLPNPGSETVWWPVRPTGLTPEPPQRVDALLAVAEAAPEPLSAARVDLPAVTLIEVATAGAEPGVGELIELAPDDGELAGAEPAAAEPFVLFDDLWVALADPFHTVADAAHTAPPSDATAARTGARRGWGRALTRQQRRAERPITLTETLVAAVVEDDFFEFLALGEPLLAAAVEAETAALVAALEGATIETAPLEESDVVRVVAVIEPAIELAQPASGVVPVGTPIAPGAAPDGFLTFVRAVTAVAIERGATRAALGLERLLCRGDVEAADQTFTGVMTQAGLLDATTGRATAALAAQTAAWRAVLRSESDDLAACGEGTLDQFACALLTAALGLPSTDVAPLRRELRRRGVAAFGMLDLAA